jgi:hypothetical protein
MSDTSDSTDTSYDVSVTAPTYDTAPAVDPAAYLPTDVQAVETGSYSYDSTDWGSVGEVSQGYTDIFNAGTEQANELYQASTDAYLAGDESAAYDLNQASISVEAGADQAWDSANSVWTDMADTTTVTSYDTTSYDTSSYDTASTDTSWSAASTDTSWSAAPADTSTEE